MFPLYSSKFPRSSYFTRICAVYLYDVGVRLSVRHLDGGNLGLSERREVLLVGERRGLGRRSEQPASLS